jgi:transcriptional regulator with XRE-family HTH domain
MDMRRLVGQNVRRIRENKGLTQERFAEISGFSQQYISGLEGRLVVMQARVSHVSVTIERRRRPRKAPFRT